jgi:serine phosphatase RsbU (regulator of sigma subunit)/tetratricopeptide (TPR) repeat protein
MSFKKQITLFILLSTILLISNLYAQNKNIDSLLILLKSDKQDTNRVVHLCLLTREYQLVGDLKNGEIFGKQSIELANKLEFQKGLAQANNNIGNIYRLLGEYSKALESYTKALDVSLLLNDKKGIATRLGNIGSVYYFLSNYPKALDFYLRALKISEEIGDKNIIARQLGNIGSIYSVQNNYSKALDYYLKSQTIYLELNEKRDHASNLGNIAFVYERQTHYQKALDHYFKALKIHEELGAKSLIGATLGNIGNVFGRQNNTKTALEYFFKALNLSEEIDDQIGIATHLNELGSLYCKTKDYKKAYNHLYRSLDISKKLNSLTNIKESYNLLSDLYQNSNVQLTDTIDGEKLNFEQMRLRSLYYFKKSVAIKDSVFSQETKKQLIQKEMNYEFEKKEALTKVENDKQQSIAKEKERVQNIIISSVLLGLLIVIIFASFIFKTLQITRKQKTTIESQKNEVSKQKEIVEKQKHIVEEKQKEIIGSITYAKRIQTALLTSEQYIQKNLPAEYFILFKPKDIVSGDFYWAFRDFKKSKEAQNELFYIITADCTGHGVPGAFMSMLNISYLNENIIEKGIKAPHEILNAQRTEVITALNPTDSQVSTKDGMDCVLCAYDFDNMVLHFAAANNPLWLVRNNELIEYKADKMPIGKYSETEDTSFTLQTITLEKGDIIYTSTDGYGDQFGMSGKKLMKKRFKEKLIEIHKAPMNEQRTLLDAFFENWKGTTEQVDDVCVIGIKI